MVVLSSPLRKPGFMIRWTDETWLSERRLPQTVVFIMIMPPRYFKKSLVVPGGQGKCVLRSRLVSVHACHAYMYPPVHPSIQMLARRPQFLLLPCYIHASAARGSRIWAPVAPLCVAGTACTVWIVRSYGSLARFQLWTGADEAKPEPKSTL